MMRLETISLDELWYSKMQVLKSVSQRGKMSHTIKMNEDKSITYTHAIKIQSMN